MTPKTRLNAELRRERGEPDLPQVSRWLAAILLPLHAAFMKCYFRIEISGATKIPASGPYILAPTHRSRWDAFMLYCAVSPRILYFMVSHDEVAGLQGWFMKRMGAFPINTQRPSPSVIRACSKMIACGKALVIFPEGNLFYYQPGEVHPLKPGVAWLALKFQEASGASDLPIIPVRLVYGDRWLRPGSRAQIVVGEPIAVSQYAGFPAKEGVIALTSALQEALGDVINRTSSVDSLRAAASA